MRFFRRFQNRTHPGYPFDPVRKRGFDRFTPQNHKNIVSDFSVKVNRYGIVCGGKYSF